MGFKLLISVAAGGAIGATARYVLMSGIGHWFGHGFPIGTFVVNVFGSFALGALIEISALVWSPSPEVRALLVVGVLGSFTTFSTFSMDIYYLYERGLYLPAFGYVLTSVIGSILAFIVGMGLLRQVLV